MSVFTETSAMIESLQTVELTGTVAQVQGLTLRVADLSMPVGAMVRVIARRGEKGTVGEVVGFDQDMTIIMLLGDTVGIRRGDRVVGLEASPTARVGEDLLGRVVNAMGQPIDGGPAIREVFARPLRPRPVDPMSRVPIDHPLGTGVRAIDAMLPAGRGQRLGIFAGPGVGKSTLLGMMARQTDAQVAVIAMVGERGREVQDFIRNSLGQRGLTRSVVVVATSDEPALMRIRAALYATSVAEFFRDQGLDVVLLMDSVTRFCQAQRQVGLAAGEPPATKGYTPSVFAALPSLLERSGRTAVGSITGFYTILVEGDDFTEPVSDACRGILDGHVMLNRELGNKGHWPAIDVLTSVSRVANDVIDRQHRAARLEVSRVMSHWRDVEDLVNIGAYTAGANPDFDLAIEMRPFIEQLLRQTPEDRVTFDGAKKHVLAVAGQVAHVTQRLKQRRPGAAAG
jgi:flagellum-specific ATP synthase